MDKESTPSSPPRRDGSEQLLRPRAWDQYIGQKTVKKALEILMGAASRRGKEPIEHILFYGPAGLGKTTLAHLVAHQMATPIKITSGPVLERASDIAALLTNLTPGEILFIDEIHRINKTVEEMLYPAMEHRSLDIIVGKGPSARTIQLDLPPFTLVGATTRIALLSQPFRTRFAGGIFRLEFYTEKEIEAILAQSAAQLEVGADSQALAMIAERSRLTPRLANQLLKRCRDVAHVADQNMITPDIVEKTFDLLGIDKAGLETEDRRFLSVLIDKFNGGPVGLSTLAAATAEDPDTIQEVYEPYLLRLGFIERTPRGRIATERAIEHLDKRKTKSEK